jgi:2Fe-2S ferredoxin
MRLTWAKGQRLDIRLRARISSESLAPRYATNAEETENFMAEEKNQGTATMDAIGENTVEVTFLPEGKTVTFEHGKLPYKDHGKEESLLDVALNNGIRLDHACGGNCACTTCHVWVKEGADNLSEMEDDEADRLDMAADLQLNSRLGCQAVITKPGKVVVEIPAWNRNYVSEEH